MISKLSAIGAAVIAIAAFAAPASAATMGFSLKVETAGTFGGKFDYPIFTLTNLSDPGLSIVSMSFTIGDPTYNFDQVNTETPSAGGAMTLTAGDASSGGARTDAFAWGFTGFDSAEFATWKAEIDPDSTNGTTDFRNVFFNNGGIAVPNSVVSVMFSNTRVLDLTLGAAPGSGSYTFSASQTVSAVPVPAALPLLASAFGVLGLMRLRSARSAA